MSALAIKAARTERAETLRRLRAMRRYHRELALTTDHRERRFTAYEVRCLLAGELTQAISEVRGA